MDKLPLPRPCIYQFAMRMEAELQANRAKGEWAAWKPDREAIKSELMHHVSKLCGAINIGESKLVAEDAADLANIAMKALEVCGE